jgi:hypothetical protein
MTGVSKMYPRGIQLRNRSIASSVALIRLGLSAFSSTSTDRLKTSENS